MRHNPSVISISGFLINQILNIKIVSSRNVKIWALLRKVEVVERHKFEYISIMNSFYLKIKQIFF